MPQSVNVAGGDRARGRAAAEAKRILEDARAMADAGAFAVVVEGTVEPLARDITAAVPIPTIGIGASPACDGQILVTDDLLGMFTDFTPRFVKRYAQVAPQSAPAAAAPGEDGVNSPFPAPPPLLEAGEQAPRKRT